MPSAHPENPYCHSTGRNKALLKPLIRDGKVMGMYVRARGQSMKARDSFLGLVLEDHDANQTAVLGEGVVEVV